MQGKKGNMSDSAEISVTTSPSTIQSDGAEHREEEAGQYQEIAHQTTNEDNRVSALYSADWYKPRWNLSH